MLVRCGHDFDRLFNHHSWEEVALMAELAAEDQARQISRLIEPVIGAFSKGKKKPPSFDDELVKELRKVAVKALRGYLGDVVEDEKDRNKRLEQKAKDLEKFFGG